jgi:hypothetical protein
MYKCLQKFFVRLKAHFSFNNFLGRFVFLFEKKFNVQFDATRDFASCVCVLNFFDLCNGEKL